MSEQSIPTSTNDPHRPLYHFTSPQNWLNDPNGLIQWRGIYHLFYQYHPFSALSGTKYWGHAISRDLAHWKHLPIALSPDPEGPDASGCWSGAAFDVDGVATILYTGVRNPDDEPQRPCLATSDDDLLQTWTKYEGNPVIPAPPPELDTVFFRDHTVWQENGIWYQGSGSGIVGQGGTVLVYRSTDLVSWEYLHPLLVGDAKQTNPFPTGTGWECPDFFSVEGKHGLIFASHGPGALNVAWVTGNYHDQQLMPTATGLVDAGPSFYAPQSFTDDAGRRIMIGWMRERRTNDEQVQDGWSGAMTLPRLLSIADDGTLHSTPAPEIALLRGFHTILGSSDLDAEGVVTTVRGDALEILATFKAGAETAGIVVRRTDDLAESVEITIDRENGVLALDTARGSLNPNTRGTRSETPIAADILSPLTIRVFVDRSVIEVFVNDRIAISDRVYPTSVYADGIAIVGQARMKSLDIWEMTGIQ